MPSTAPPPMNERWSQQFTPKLYIRDEWYQSVMDPPTWEEWNNTIHSLPNDKACGPSKLHNEFYKHAGPHVALLTWQLAKMCFQLEFIPDEWKQAHIYPI